MRKSSSFGSFLLFSILVVGVGVGAGGGCSPTSGQIADAGPVDTGIDAPAGSCPASDVLQGKALTGAGTQHLGLTGNEVWHAQDSPHIVGTNILSVNMQTLTIEPCSVVVMSDGSAVSVIAGGDLIAVGDATHPILVTGQTKSPGSWADFELSELGGQTHLSYVTVEFAGNGSDADTLRVDTAKNFPVIDNTTLRNGTGVGIALKTQLGAGFTGNTITKMSGAPIEAEFPSIGSIADGAYTGNGEDRVRITTTGGPVASAMTWHKLSIPYHYFGCCQDVNAVLTVEPGVTAFIEDVNGGAPMGGQQDFQFSKGGKLLADGQSEAGRITFQSVTPNSAASWAGIEFDADAATGNVMHYVTVDGAGLIPGAEAQVGACPATMAYAIEVTAAGQLDLQHSTIANVAPMGFAIGRDWCGVADIGFAAPADMNTFTGTMVCPQTDQFPCMPKMCGGGNCCDHPFQCWK
jgi:hypothetical protein